MAASFLKVIKSDEEWRKQLTSIQYQITRQHGTERAFSSPDFDIKESGILLVSAVENRSFIPNTNMIREQDGQASPKPSTHKPLPFLKIYLMVWCAQKSAVQIVMPI